mmetsp:Transcript_9094/g.13688  ORF Transcript_9094/g.13688 Transcript_9094/m.13688 type:complete len:442 (+) Transcript_9094:91-1416(+)|eukprot:CAMPEP_0185030584 /NCGR_PEP_ID=MMETSP1103-20130426/17562_1 /TAXON_ID=36769 /ORGANISM="Paraphysomonas bandaiensis, Strain Caron Lab Isolate" /LENGTH=441 /DNA_ID=CAMNT_0027565775 /DNA_START=8 /DNA_END=1333 /DNA_ORIENTATION=+
MINSTATRPDNDDGEVLFEHPATLMGEHGTLIITLQRIIWKPVKSSIPLYSFRWREICSVQTGRVGNCGVRITQQKETTPIEIFIGQSSPVIQAQMEKMRRAIKKARHMGGSSNGSASSSALQLEKNESVRFKHPVFLDKKKSRKGTLYVTTRRLVWMSDKSSTQIHSFEWHSLSSIQVGRSNFCSLRVTIGNDEKIKYYFGRSSPATLATMDKLKEAVISVQQSIMRSSSDHCSLYESYGSADSSSVSNGSAMWVSSISRGSQKTESPNSAPSVENQPFRRSEQGKSHATDLPLSPTALRGAMHGRRQMSCPADLSPRRVSPLENRVHGNVISARVAIRGGRRSHSTTSIPEVVLGGDNDEELRPPSPGLMKYIRRGNLMRKQQSCPDIASLRATMEKPKESSPQPKESIVEFAKSLIAQKKEKRAALAKLRSERALISS